jgi:hypothetical protein
MRRLVVSTCFVFSFIGVFVFAFVVVVGFISGFYPHSM